MWTNTYQWNVVLLRMKSLTGSIEKVSTGYSSGTEPIACHAIMTIDDNINTQLRKFWELEEFNRAPKITDEEQRCKDQFDSTRTRNENGRFVVVMPFQSASEKLGESLPQAIKRFRFLESKFKSRPDLKMKYTANLQEYIDMDPMEINPGSEVPIQPESSFYNLAFSIFCCAFNSMPLQCLPT